jgi:hypothetical protein
MKKYTERPNKALSNLRSFDPEIKAEFIKVGRQALSRSVTGYDRAAATTRTGHPREQEKSYLSKT